MTTHRVQVVTLLSVIVVFTLLLVHPFISYQTMIDHMVIGAAVPVTAFVLLYPILSPQWWQTWIGRALFTSKMGLALLLDLTLLAKWFDLILPRPAVTLIMLLILAGGWFTLIALLRAKWPDVRIRWRPRRSDKR